ncbi:MAG: hypothetical protein IJB36_01620 [Clostridia bacterium]|nr:hypothetical protein [Clostridia bacterium]
MVSIQSKEEAIEILHNKILAAIKQQPRAEYWLQYVPDEARIRPYGYISFNIETKELKKREYDYDMRDETTQYFTAAEFHDYAIRYNLNEELKFFETEEDWERLAEKLLVVYKSLRGEEDERLRLSHGVMIPGSWKNRVPEMNLKNVYLSLTQVNGSSSVEIIRTGGCYKLHCYYGGHYSRDLTSIECVWVEQKVKAAIESSDRSCWASRMGFDCLSVKISRDGFSDIEQSGQPLNKYIRLQNKLQKLSMYGFYFKSE